MAVSDISGTVVAVAVAAVVALFRFVGEEEGDTVAGAAAAGTLVVATVSVSSAGGVGSVVGFFRVVFLDFLRFMVVSLVVAREGNGMVLTKRLLCSF